MREAAFGNEIPYTSNAFGQIFQRMQEMRNKSRKHASPLETKLPRIRILVLEITEFQEHWRGGACADIA